MMDMRRAPGTMAGWVCLLAALLHALAFVAHTGRAAAAAPAGLTAALAGALCTASEEAAAHAFDGGTGEDRPAPASGCPICTAGAAVVALPAPAGPELATRPACAERSGPMSPPRLERTVAGEATPIRGPPPGRVIASL